MNMNEKEFVVILSRNAPVGFFSLFNQVLGWLWICDQENKVPLAYFNDNCSYWEDGGWNNSRNAWEFYFKPLSNYAITDVIHSDLNTLEGARAADFCTSLPTKETRNHSENIGNKILIGRNITVTSLYKRDVSPNPFYVDEQKRGRYHSLINKYIEVQDNIHDEIDSFFENNFKGNRVIGVHVRGAEHNDEITVYCKKGALSIDHYIREINKYLKTFPAAKIFIASDNEKSVEALKSEYGDKLMFFDSLRLQESDDTLVSGVHHPNSKYGGAARGKEVLIECLLLARCDYFIHGKSNVSNAATFFNPTLDHVDIYQAYAFKARILYFIHFVETSRCYLKLFGIKELAKRFFQRPGW